MVKNEWSNRYFLNQYKTRRAQTTMTELNYKDAQTEDPGRMANIVKEYYDTLYRSA